MARVLIVDDEPSMRVALKSLLQSNGHETVEASSGIEALAHLDGIDLEGGAGAPGSVVFVPCGSPMTGPPSGTGQAVSIDPDEYLRCGLRHSIDLRSAVIRGKNGNS
jgi:CheY-like chemotaxis protein